MLFGWEVHPTLWPPWSLTTEWLFYLVFPAAVLVAVRNTRRRRPWPAGALFRAAGLYVCAMPLTHGQSYAVPIANLASCVLAEPWRLRTVKLDRSGSHYHRIGPVRITRHGPYLRSASGRWRELGIRLSVLPATTLATAVMIHGVHHGHPITRFLAWRPFVHVLVRAYSLYLWHVPVMWLVWRWSATGVWLGCSS